MAKPIDIVEQSLDRITSLHRDQQKYRAFVTAVLRQLQPIIDACEAILLWRDLALARGDALYRIAEIVGAPIVYGERTLFVFFGFDGQDYAMPLWDETMPELTGGRWREHGETEIDLDYLFDMQRVVIRAEILKNHSHGYTPEIAQSLAMLFGADLAFVENNKNMTFDVNVGHMLTPVEVFLIRDFDILPRPAGVDLRNFVYWEKSLPVFGFDHQANTEGFDAGYLALMVNMNDRGDFDGDYSSEVLSASVGR
jgi:Protein of unknown function (DUF2612)